MKEELPIDSPILILHPRLFLLQWLPNVKAGEQQLPPNSTRAGGYTPWVQQKGLCSRDGAHVSLGIAQTHTHTHVLFITASNIDQNGKGAVIYGPYVNSPTPPGSPQRSTSQTLFLTCLPMATSRPQSPPTTHSPTWQGRLPPILWFHKNSRQ